MPNGFDLAGLLASSPSSPHVSRMNRRPRSSAHPSYRPSRRPGRRKRSRESIRGFVNLITGVLLLSGSSSSWTTSAADSWRSAASSPSHLRRHATRDLLAGVCPLGCNSHNASSSSTWCDAGCFHAYAHCNRGGSDNPTCFNVRPDTLWESYFNVNIESGWTNSINCNGGILACELWTGASQCNTTSRAESRFVGLAMVDTDLGTLDFGLIDATLGVSAIHLYMGKTPLPVATTNQSLWVSPEDDLPQKSWYQPRVQRATIALDGDILPTGDQLYFIAQVAVCPSPTTTTTSNLVPTVAPSTASAPSPATLVCPVPAPPPSPLLDALASTTTDTPVVVAVESSVVVGAVEPSPSGSSVRSLQAPPTPPSDSCVAACKDDGLACDANCQMAYAYCPDANPITCLFGTTNVTSTRLLPWEGWSNAVPCQGGSFLCELWMGAADCDRNTTSGTSSSSTLIGRLVVHTNENRLDLSLSARNYVFSSVHVQWRSSTSNSEEQEDAWSLQQQWMNPNARQASLALNDPLRADHILVVQAVVCPNGVVNPQSPTPGPSSPSIATDSPTATTVPLCPIASPYGGTDTPTLELVFVPTVTPQLTTNEPTTGPTSAAEAGDDGTNPPVNGPTTNPPPGGDPTGGGNGGPNGQLDDDKSSSTGAPTCKPQRTPSPSLRPGPLLVIPPIFKPHLIAPSSSAPSLVSSGVQRPSEHPHMGRRMQRGCEPDADDDGGFDDGTDDRIEPTDDDALNAPTPTPTDGSSNGQTSFPSSSTSETAEPTFLPEPTIRNDARPTKIPTTRPTPTQKVVDKPTFSPSVTARPSLQPTITSAPTISRAPTISPKPSRAPTISPKPTDTRIPTSPPTTGIPFRKTEYPTRLEDVTSPYPTNPVPDPEASNPTEEPTPIPTKPVPDPEEPDLTEEPTPIPTKPLPDSEGPIPTEEPTLFPTESVNRPEPSPTDEATTAPSTEPTKEPLDPTIEPTPVREPDPEPTPLPSRLNEPD